MEQQQSWFQRMTVNTAGFRGVVGWQSHFWHCEDSKFRSHMIRYSNKAMSNQSSDPSIVQNPRTDQGQCHELIDEEIGWEWQSWDFESGPFPNSHSHKTNLSLLWIYFVLWELMGFPGGSDGKASACNARDLGLIPGSRKSPGEGNGNPLQHSCLENPMDRGAWWATVHVSCPYSHLLTIMSFCSLNIEGSSLIDELCFNSLAIRCLFEI